MSDPNPPFPGPPPSFDAPPPPPPGWAPPAPPGPPPAYGSPPPPYGAPPGSGASPGYGPPGYGAPPGYGLPGYGYGYAPPPAPIKSLKGLSVAVVVLLLVTAVVDVVGVVLGIGVVSGYPADRSTDLFDSFQTSDDFSAALGGHFLLVVVVAVLWIIWQHRHAGNAKRLGRTGITSSVAIWGWFLPVAGPILGGVELAASAKPSNGGRTPPVVLAWAATLLLGSLLVIGSVLATPAEEFPRTDGDRASMRLVGMLGAGGLAALVVAALLAVLVVLQLSRTQDEALRASGLR